MRRYRVLRRNGEPDETWEQVDTVQAAGSEQAIRAAAGTTAGTYAAVPERNWNQVTVTVEQPAPRIKLEKPQ